MALILANGNEVFALPLRYPLNGWIPQTLEPCAEHGHNTPVLEWNSIVQQYGALKLLGVGCFLMAIGLWCLGRVVGIFLSVFGSHFGCYECGWKGRRDDLYRPFNIFGEMRLLKAVVEHALMPYYMLIHAVARMASPLACPECGSREVARLTSDAPPLPPPRKSRAARAWLKNRPKPN